MRAFLLKGHIDLDIMSATPMQRVRAPHRAVGNQASLNHQSQQELPRERGNLWRTGRGERRPSDVRHGSVAFVDIWDQTRRVFVEKSITRGVKMCENMDDLKQFCNVAGKNGRRRI